VVPSCAVCALRRVGSVCLGGRRLALAAGSSTDLRRASLCDRRRRPNYRSAARAPCMASSRFS
jgi:hypothetical protein